MKKLSKTDLAKSGETAATNYLLYKGYSLICRNFRVKQGEIDLIVEKDQQLIFVEVKTRSYHSIESAIASVSHQKQAHISRVANIYCSQNPQYCKHNTRFDVIVALYDASLESFSIKHFEDAFLPVDSAYQ
jgi:putative endonuclease